MRRITALLLMLLLLPGLVAAEDDFDLDDILSDADPDVVKNTYSQPGNADDILLIQREQRSTVIYTRDGGRFVTTDTLSDLEERLNPATFFRCHKSYIVNLNHLRPLDIHNPAEGHRSRRAHNPRKV